VVSVRPERVVTTNFGRDVVLDVRTREREFELGYVPLGVLMDQVAFFQWRTGYQQHFEYAPGKSRFLDEFHQRIVTPLLQYKVPVIELLKTTPKEAVCQVFEHVNTGGVSLTVFELMTATYAADDFRLRDDWDTRSTRLEEHPVLSAVDATAFLTAVTLLASYERSRSSGRPVACKRRDVLALALEEYVANAQRVEEGLVRAAQLLHREQIFDARTLPYSTQLVPLAVLCGALGDRFHDEPVKKKLIQWYWCGVFGELYGSALETRFAYDVVEVLAWIEGGDTPRTIRDAGFDPVRLLGLQSRLSAAYKGLMAQLMKVGSDDFLSGDRLSVTSYFELAVDIHHVFPRAYCHQHGFEQRKWNSVVNKAALAARTNRIIGGNAPSRYLGDLESNHGMERARLDEILRSHLIDPNLLRSDDFHGFLRDRAIRLLDLIEGAMGKRVSGRDSDEVVREFGAPLQPSPGDTQASVGPPKDAAAHDPQSTSAHPQAIPAQTPSVPLVEVGDAPPTQEPDLRPLGAPDAASTGGARGAMGDLAMMRFSNNEEAAHAVVRHLENSAPARGHLALRPFNRFDTEFTAWWLVPSTDWPAYQYGKLALVRFGDETHATDQALVGFYVERGFGSDACGIGAVPRTQILTADWRWHRFIQSAAGGAADAVALEVARRAGLPVVTQISIWAINNQPTVDEDKLVPDDWFSLTLNGENAGTASWHPSARTLRALHGARSLQQIARQLATVDGLDFFWVNLVVGIAVRYGQPRPGAWGAAELWHRALEPWLKEVL